MTAYIYGDGSANVYRVTPTTIEYDPVKPKYSSSGIYDGGEPVLKNIATAAYKEVGELIATALANKAEHIEHRTKMSGSVTIRTATDTTSFILAARSKGQKDLEALLKRLISA